MICPMVPGVQDCTLGLTAVLFILQSKIALNLTVKRSRDTSALPLINLVVVHNLLMFSVTWIKVSSLHISRNSGPIGYLTVQLHWNISWLYFPISKTHKPWFTNYIDQSSQGSSWENLPSCLSCCTAATPINSSSLTLDKNWSRSPWVGLLILEHSRGRTNKWSVFVIPTLSSLGRHAYIHTKVRHRLQHYGVSRYILSK